MPKILPPKNSPIRCPDKKIKMEDIEIAGTHGICPSCKRWIMIESFNYDFIWLKRHIKVIKGKLE